MRSSQTCRLLCLCCQLAGCQDDAILLGTGVYARKFRNEITGRNGEISSKGSRFGCQSCPCDLCCQLLQCCPASMVNFVWFTDDKLSKFCRCSPKKRPKWSRSRTCRYLLTFTRSSKTMHQHTELVRWLSFWLARHLTSYLLSCLVLTWTVFHQWIGWSLSSQHSHQFRQASLLSWHTSWCHSYATTREYLSNN